MFHLRCLAGFWYAHVKFGKIISFRIISKITVNCKGKAFTRLERHHRHFPWKLLSFGKLFWMVFQNFISTDTVIFKVGNKVASIASIDAFIIISYQDIMRVPWRVEIFAGIPFRKVQVFTIIITIATILNKHMFKVNDRKDSRTNHFS